MSWWFFALAGVGACGPGILLELGVLRDKDEFARRAEVPALRRVRRDEFNFQPGIDVTDAAQVKGLEFDYVVVVDANVASYPDASWSRHLLHIAVTRAAHQLWLVSTAVPSPLVPAALRDGGRMGVAVESVA